MMNDTRDRINAHKAIWFSFLWCLNNCARVHLICVYMFLNLLTASMMQHIHVSKAKDMINHHSYKWTSFFFVYIVFYSYNIFHSTFEYDDYSMQQIFFHVKTRPSYLTFLIDVQYDSVVFMYIYLHNKWQLVQLYQ